MKIQMNLDDFKGAYAMACPTYQSAKMFCEFLHSEGRKWINGKSYKKQKQWMLYNVETVYFFNLGLYGSITAANAQGCKILDIKEFIVK